MLRGAASRGCTEQGARRGAFRRFGSRFFVPAVGPAVCSIPHGHVPGVQGRARMTTTTYTIDPDITTATTLPSSFYRDDAAFEAAKDRVFARSWQWLGDVSDVAHPG